MAANTGKLAGRTLFITGASRGIGLAIARKAAKDGANIVIAAKTTEPHAKLPGTIYTAAKEVEAAGGKCLPCVVDIRFEDQVKNAVEQAVQKFGGIDILINNASAINLTGTMETSMKKYDLMMGINARGTFLCSQACIPYLKNGMNPHILNLSPPLNMHVRWFKSHVAYTMAKYGMSLCALGMAEELKPFGIAVNTLWPRTAIYTAAMKMLGGDDVVSHCRKPEIVADAAYVILTKDSKTVTGNFYVDDVVLKENGVTDLEQYACIPGSKLLPDYFLDDEDVADISIESSHSTASASAAGSALKTFQAIEKLLSEDLVKSINGVFQFNLVGAEPGTWHIDMLNGKGSVGQGLPPGGCQCTMSLESEDFVKMFSGSLKPTAAFMAGKLKIEGDMGLALKLEKLMGVFQSKL